MTKIYLAYASAADTTLERHAADEPVDLLVAYPLLAEFQKKRHQWNVRSWVLDSGAYSVFNSGKIIDVEDYISACRDVDAVEIFGLDVIGDYVGTRRNNERMWEAGIEAIPTFHLGDPWSALEAMLHRPKIALGGIVQASTRNVVHASGTQAWLGQCFARVWPKRLHGFGLVRPKFIEAYPFHSVDASSWNMAPARFGKWAGYTGHQVQLPGTARVRGNKQSVDFWIEVLEYKRRERWAAWRWREQLAEIDRDTP